MTAFTGQICIKTPSGMLCSASPIVQCGTAGPSTPSDPYAHLATTSASPDDPDVFIAEVTKIVKSRADILLGKGNGALRVIQLLLHPDVKNNEPFVITALTCGND
jgi:hypothetical protein